MIAITSRRSGLGRIQRLSRGIAGRVRTAFDNRRCSDLFGDFWRPPATGPRIAPKDFEANLRAIIARTRKAGAEPILMTANPLRWTPELRERYGKPLYDVTRPDGFEAPTLVRYNEITGKLAAELRVPLVDIHQEFSRRDVDKLLLDGMHPNDAGHDVIAQRLVPVIRELARSGASSKKATRPKR